ncbi:MAG: F0F1 ATP synthase subunit alpha, partial [Actinomycetota bacterium]
NERSPLAVEDQVIQLYAATNGFLDRIDVDKVEKFLVDLTRRAHSEAGDLRKAIAGGDWSDETEKGVHELVERFASDFGFDLDEEGQPLEENAAPARPAAAPAEREQEAAAV